MPDVGGLARGNKPLGRRGDGAGNAVGSIAEVFLAFLELGLTSFGGPIAHLGYFRDSLVRRRGWIDDASYAEVVALCQFLPGPASSQVGFCLGLLRSGRLLGGLAAWVAFTLPSASLLFVCAVFADRIGGVFGAGLIHGLKLVAVSVVAQAVWGMAKSLAPDRARAAIAVVALAFTATITGGVGQIGAIAFGAIVGLVVCRQEPCTEMASLPVRVTPRAGVVSLALFAVFLVVPRFVPLPTAAVFDAFYRSGALVFGGGHVVLPLLRSRIVDPGWMSPDTFLAGYGLAQAVPGPLFTVSAFLGASLRTPPNGLLGASIALIAIFLPGLLLAFGLLPFWSSIRIRPAVRAAMRGANAAVVGILGAALYDPVWTGALVGPRDVVVVVAGFVALTTWNVAPWTVVTVSALAGVAFALF